MGRARHPGVARVGRRATRRRPTAPALGGGSLRRIGRAAAGAVLAAAAATGCKALTPDFDAIIAIEVVVPDSGRLEVGDTLRPRARAINGRGDSTAATFVWSALDSTLQIVDSATGLTLGRFVGAGRLVARAGALRSNAVTITVRAPIDSIEPTGPTRDTVVVSAPDSLSDSLRIQAFGPAGSTASVKIALSVAAFPPGPAGLTLVPGDTVRTSGTGIAQFQVRLTGTRPDSAVVTASARHADGTVVAGSPVTFVVEFLP